MADASPAGTPPGGAATEPTEEEFRAAIEEQLRTLEVGDVVIQSIATLMTLGARRLGIAPGSEGERDIAEAQMAIDAARALAAVLPDAESAPIREPLSQLQMAFVQATRGGEGDAGVDGPKTPEAPAAAEPSDEAKAAEARARIWTPPGT